MQGNKPITDTSKVIYQAFEYDSSIVDGDEYRKRLLHQGWQEIEDSKEYEKHGYPLTIGTRLNTHRDTNIESFVLKRLAQPTEKDS